MICLLFVALIVVAAVLYLREPSEPTARWRVVYRDGKRSAWMSYSNAKEFAAIFGGEIEERTIL